MSVVRKKRVLAHLCAAVLAVAGLSVSTAPTASAETQVKVRLTRAIKSLPVAAETRTGYDRAKFRLWVDADRDCRDTRDEVLAAESLVRVSGCDIQRGKWRSYYDGVVTRSSSDLRHRPPGAARRGLGLRRATLDRCARGSGTPTTSGDRRTPGRGDRLVQPVEVRPGPGRVDAPPRQVQVRPAVGGGQAPLVADGQRRREASAAGARPRTCANDVHHRPSCARSRRSTSTSTGGSTGGTTSRGGTDPRFSYCYQAIAAGYGPYVRGRDPEYALVHRQRRRRPRLRVLSGARAVNGAGSRPALSASGGAAVGVHRSRVLVVPLRGRGCSEHPAD